jgi:hypothetical protein
MIQIEALDVRIHKLGLVPRLRHRLGPAWDCCDCARSGGHRRLYAVFRVLLVIAAGIEVVQAIMVGKWVGLYHHWLAAVLFGVVGALMIWRPVATAEGFDLY